MSNSSATYKHSLQCAITAHNQGDHLATASHIHNAVYEYGLQHCLHSTTKRIYNKVTQQYVEYSIPCGKCYYCQHSRQHDWVSRMSLHTENYKYCYFLTLTYRGYDTYDEIPTFLRNAFFHQDAWNAEQSLCYSPCLLRYNHLQRFWKYLRKQLPTVSHLSFYSCGEYGSTYGRPHFHAIIWSDCPILTAQVERAWSTRAGLIGRVELNDLNSNGTIAGDGVLNSSMAFRYVSKYVSKSISERDKSLLSSRYKFFADAISSRQTIMNNLSALHYVFDKHLCTRVSVLSSWDDLLSEYALQRHNEDCYEQNKGTYPYQMYDFEQYKHLFYEKRETCSHLHDASISQSEIQSLSVVFFSSTPYLWRRLFAPFCRASNRYVIGKDYLLKNIDRFARGNSTVRSSLYDKCSFVRYFARQTSLYVQSYAYQLHDKLHISSSLVPFCSEDELSSFLSKRCCVLPDPSLDFAYTNPLYSRSAGRFLLEYRINRDFLQKFAIKDLRTNTYLLYACRALSMPCELYRYQYDRKARKYVCIGALSLSDFMVSLSTSIQAFYEYTRTKIDVIKHNLQEFETLSQFYDSTTELFDFDTFVDSLVYDLPPSKPKVYDKKRLL